MKKKYTKIDKVIKKIIKQNRKYLVGLAHYDIGVKQKGCDCYYCKPKKGKQR